MEVQSVVTLKPESQPSAFKSPVIDLSVHELIVNDIRFSVYPDTPEQIRSRLHFNPSEDQRIKINVNKFVQHPTYKYFIYKEGIEPAMVDYRECVVCHTEMVDVSGLRDCRGVGYLTLGLCPECGFFQHTKRPPKEWYADFYRKQWNPGMRDPNNWPQDIKPFDPVLKNVFSFCGPGSRVLEVGSGWGHSLLAFKKHGYKTFGVEATSHRSQFIRERLGMACFTGEAEDVPIGTDPFMPESFDLVFSTNVLEHVYSTRQVIEHVHKLIKPNGMAFLEVPIYYQENLSLNTHGISHTCNFSHANFLYLCQSIGFDLIKDFSTPDYASFLLRKAPPLTEEQKASKLSWMRTFLPQRGLATIFERNGLAFLLDQPVRDYACDFAWHLAGEECFIRLQYDVPYENLASLKALRSIIKSRADIREAAPYLPLQYVYGVEGAPIWYY